MPKRIPPFLHHNPTIAGAVLHIFLRAVRSTLRQSMLRIGLSLIVLAALVPQTGVGQETFSAQALVDLPRDGWRTTAAISTTNAIRRSRRSTARTSVS